MLLEILDILDPKVNVADQDHKEALVLQVVHVLVKAEEKLSMEANLSLKHYFWCDQVPLVIQVEKMAPHTIIVDLLEPLETQGSGDIQVPQIF